MTLKEAPQIGDKVRYIGKKGGINFDVTKGTVYTISTSVGDYAAFVDDTCEDETVIFDSDFGKFELVSDAPSVIDLLANLALRVSELERHNREQAYEINELYKEVSR